MNPVQVSGNGVPSSVPELHVYGAFSHKGQQQTAKLAA